MYIIESAVRYRAGAAGRLHNSRDAARRRRHNI